MPQIANNATERSVRSSAKLFLCGDVMLGRGIDQILRQPGDPQLLRALCQIGARPMSSSPNASMARSRSTVDDAYVWGDALGELDREAPDARIINLETSVTTSLRPGAQGDQLPDAPGQHRLPGGGTASTAACSPTTMCSTGMSPASSRPSIRCGVPASPMPGPGWTPTRRRRLPSSNWPAGAACWSSASRSRPAASQLLGSRSLQASGVNLLADVSARLAQADRPIGRRP